MAEPLVAGAEGQWQEPLSRAHVSRQNSKAALTTGEAATE